MWDLVKCCTLQDPNYHLPESLIVVSLINSKSQTTPYYRRNFSGMHSRAAFSPVSASCAAAGVVPYEGSSIVHAAGHKCWPDRVLWPIAFQVPGTEVLNVLNHKPEGGMLEEVWPELVACKLATQLPCANEAPTHNLQQR